MSSCHTCTHTPTKVCFHLKWDVMLLHLHTLSNRSLLSTEVRCHLATLANTFQQKSVFNWSKTSSYHTLQQKSAFNWSKMPSYHTLQQKSAFNWSISKMSFCHTCTGSNRSLLTTELGRLTNWSYWTLHMLSIDQESLHFLTDCLPDIILSLAPRRVKILSTGVRRQICAGT